MIVSFERFKFCVEVGIRGLRVNIKMEAALPASFTGLISKSRPALWIWLILKMESVQQPPSKPHGSTTKQICYPVENIYVFNQSYCF